jgi:hypothetical protein
VAKDSSEFPRCRLKGDQPFRIVAH